MRLEEESRIPACGNPKDHQEQVTIEINICKFDGKCPYKIHGLIRINTDYCTYSKKESGRLSRVEV